MPAGQLLRPDREHHRDHRRPARDLPFVVVNIYGPAENTVATTTATVAASARESDPPPIGRPIANHRVYLLDADLDPVPIGVAGQLHAASCGLARGYRGRPGLTAEKFIPNPFASEPGSRLYKTGDLARYLGDGNVDFLGRIDQKAKIRGLRIELGEIEAALDRHPAVRAAVAVVREDLPGDPRLLAYFVPDRRPAPTAGELRLFLRDWLPDSMIPAAFLPLEALPLTANGKVDRRALPPPEELELRRETPLVAPRTEIEQTIVAIWKEVLQTDRAGIHDNFFDLGGHSMNMAVLADKLREACDCELSLVELFQVLSSTGSGRPNSISSG